MATPFQTVDTNTAGKADRARIPGVGQSTAGPIVRYREEHGGFRSVDERGKAVALPRFGVEGIRKYVTVGEEQQSGERTSA